ncbi:MAG: ABC transporter ATP-binding protein [Acidobacteria bacterium]|nr:ABC transporter ATP-binding protein [Acidobacteriota bacterium]
MSDSQPTKATSGARDDAIISVRDVVVRYGDKTILDGVNLDIRAGETMVIMGASGSGKSTLLRRIMGLDKPTSGHIFVKGVDITTASEKELNDIRRIMGISFQSAALFNSMTLGDNVALPLREHTNLAESTIKLMTRMKLGQVGLAEAEDLLPSQLSGGMRKRASVARAIAMDPEILLFDEPSAGLDPIIAAEIDGLILDLKSAFKMTIVVVTHELASAFLIADRMCMLRYGKMLAIGTKDEIRNSEHPRIRQFLDRIPDKVTGGQDEYLQSLTKL